MRGLLALVVALCSLSLVGLVPALAQDATPGAGMGEVVDAADCRVEPRSVDELLALWYQDEAGTPTLAITEPPANMFPTAVPVPLGEPADASTVAGVTAWAREALACSNALDVTRWLALFSDDLAQQLGLSFGFKTIEDARAFLEAPAVPRPDDQRIRLVAVTDVSVMADGRVAALIAYDDPMQPPAGVESEVVFFVEEDGRRVADGIVEFTVIEEGGKGMPIP